MSNILNTVKEKGESLMAFFNTKKEKIESQNIKNLYTFSKEGFT